MPREETKCWRQLKIQTPHRPSYVIISITSGIALLTVSHSCIHGGSLTQSIEVGCVKRLSLLRTTESSRKLLSSPSGPRGSDRHSFHLALSNSTSLTRKKSIIKGVS